MRQVCQSIVFLAVAIIVSSRLAFAGDAVFLVAGQFSAATDSVQFEIELLNTVTNAQTLRFQTLAHSGGLSDTGLAIGSGGFDPIVEWLGISPFANLGLNDDGNPGPGPNYNRDSLLSWQGVAGNPVPTDGYLKTSGGSSATAMSAGQYVLELRAYGPAYPAGLTKPWAIDIVAPWSAIRLSDIDQSGTLTGLLFGGKDALSPAAVNLDGNNLNFAAPTGGLLDVIHVGVTQAGHLIMSNGAQLSATSTPLIVGQSVIGSHSTMSVSDAGTHVAVGTVTVQQGDVLIYNQGSWASGSADIGTSTSDGTVTVNGYVTGIGTSARWDIAGHLDIGPDGATGDRRGRLIAEQSGRVTVSGDASVHGTTESISDITVQTNGNLNVGGDLNIGGYAWVQLLGGRITTETLIAAVGGALIHEDGTLTIDGGVFVPSSSPVNYVINGASSGDLPTVILDNGGTLTTSGHDVYVGDDNRGKLEVHGGSVVTRLGIHDTLVLGVQPGGYGEVVVTGPGSAIESVHATSIGPHGDGVLRVLDGGRVEDTDALNIPVGSASGSTGLLEVSGFNGAPSTFHTAGRLDVGEFGVGTVVVSDGGLVEAGRYDTFIAGSASASGSSVTVRDPGSRFAIHSDMYIGGFAGWSGGGAGTLRVENGGAAEVDGTLRTWPAGTVELVSGSITCGSFLVSAGGTFTHEDGTLTVDGGTFAPDVTSGDYALNGADMADLPTVILDNGAIMAISGRSIVVGTSHRGRFEVRAGSSAQLQSTYDVLVLGQYAGSYGEALVTGPGSLIESIYGTAIGTSGDGVLRVLDGGRVEDTNSPYEPIGDQTGTNGLLEVSGVNGAPSTFRTRGELYIGNAGVGTVVVSQGGLLDVVGTNAYVAVAATAAGSIATISDPGSRFVVENDLHVGGYGSGSGGAGTLTVQNGGAVEVGAALSTSATGTVELLGSSITCRSFSVEYGGTFTHEDGTLTVDGGPITSAYYISPNGADPGDNPTVVLTNGATLSQYQLFIGYDNPGTMRVLNGSTCDVTVAGGHLALGWHGGFAAEGSLDVNGRHPTTNARATVTTVAPLIVGAAGIGNATIGDGGQMNVVGTDVFIAQYAGAGTLTVDGPDAYLSVGGDVHVGGDPSTGDGGQAEFNISNEAGADIAGAVTIYGRGTVLLGGALTADTIDHTHGGALNFKSGHLAASTFLGHLTVDGDGWLHPGQSVGTTTVSDGLEMLSASHLVIEIDSADSSDLLYVTGAAAISSELMVVTVGGFLPLYGSQWTMVYATGGITGSVIAPLGYAVSLSEDTMTMYLTRTAPNLLGDANNDGVVSADDFAAVQANFGSTGTSDGSLLGDANDDGVVSADDFASIQANFGNVQSTSMTSDSIPEPTTFALACLSAMALVKRQQ